MDRNIIELPEMYLLGVSARTNNVQEMNPQSRIIPSTMQTFFSVSQPKIPNKVNPGKILALYTNYQSDFNGDYTYFIGQEVMPLKELPADLEYLEIPVQTFAKFTSSPGVMPHVVIDMWQKIWQMTTLDLGGDRAYIADFEIYDERSHNPQEAVVDIYIGIQR